MSTIQSIKGQLQELIDSANATTGNADTNLTDGVNSLIEGYGSGGTTGGSSGNIKTYMVGNAISNLTVEFETNASLYMEVE